MKEAMRSSVLPVMCLLVHAPASAQVREAGAAGTPTPQTELFVEDARWVPASRGEVPAGAIAHGREPDGRPEFICRARTGSGLHLGRISQGSTGCVVVSHGRVVTQPTYQVLTELHTAGIDAPRESVTELIRRRFAESGTKPPFKRRR
jgi:hypothetical protein